MILATTDHQRTRLWDLGDRQHPRMLATVAAPGFPVAFSADGHVLATIGDNTDGQLWDVTDPRHPRALTDVGVLDSPQAVAFSPRGHILATVLGDQVVLWDITNANSARMIASMASGIGDNAALTFDPTGHLLAADGSNGRIRLWNVSDPNHPGQLATLAGNPSDSNTVTFSLNGRTLATTGLDQTVQLWDLADPAHPALRAVLTDALRPVMFHPDGHTLAVIGANGSVQLRETDADAATARLCAVATAAIARAAWDQYFPGLVYRPPCQ
jgi:WD40 repeat protein